MYTKMEWVFGAKVMNELGFCDGLVEPGGRQRSRRHSGNSAVGAVKIQYLVFVHNNSDKKTLLLIVWFLSLTSCL